MCVMSWKSVLVCWYVHSVAGRSSRSVLMTAKERSSIRRVAGVSALRVAASTRCARIAWKQSRNDNNECLDIRRARGKVQLLFCRNFGIVGRLLLLIVLVGCLRDEFRVNARDLCFTCFSLVTSGSSTHIFFNGTEFFDEKIINCQLNTGKSTEINRPSPVNNKTRAKIKTKNINRASPLSSRLLLINKGKNK